MQITISRMQVEDAKAVSEIETRSFSEPWPLSEFEKAAESENYIYLVAKEDNLLVGYAGCTVVCDEADITNIAVAEEYKGHGIGDTLLNVLMDEARKKGAANVYLEVRMSNEAAKALYIKNGFEQIGVRPHFYKLPDETAILMQRKL